MPNYPEPFSVDFGKYTLEQYPDYRKDQPPDVYKLGVANYLDEFQSIWGRQWGAMGMGRLREVALCKPLRWETSEFFTQDPNFFLLRFSGKLNFDDMARAHDQLPRS